MEPKTFGAKDNLLIDDKIYAYFRINALEEMAPGGMARLPYSVKILLENVLRCYETRHQGGVVKRDDVLRLADWRPHYDKAAEIPFFPSRVIMQDFTGVPAVVDLAAMRDAVAAMGKDPAVINPAIPVDLVVDHSIQVDHQGAPYALFKNMDLEYHRNRERYALLKWAQKAFGNFRIFPSGSGIIHQVNLEYIATVVAAREQDGEAWLFPDSLIGTDSHTTMIDGLGIVGWGVGGIEAEAVMLGQPIYMKIPEVVGVKITGIPPVGATATDLVLTVTQMLRKEKVVDKFVEFFGPSLRLLTLPDRATIANMAPEYGATMGFFPVDDIALEYLKVTNRGRLVKRVETYARAQGLFHAPEETAEYSKILELDLSATEPSLAGPRRPQDRVPLNAIKSSFGAALKEMTGREQKKMIIDLDGEATELSDGDVVIAAITSCTNTSNPAVVIGAGLLAKNAVEKGLTVKKHVKTSFAPGSLVVGAYLQAAGLMPYLEKLGFHIVGYGCTTCIGNSGPLHPAIDNAIRDHGLVAAAVLSGNRNFEARIHQRVRANYLASPILVAAFALAGRMAIDFGKEPLGVGTDGRPVFLKDIYPDNHEIQKLMDEVVTPEVYENKYRSILDGDENWSKLEAAEGATFNWDPSSTYIRRAPFADVAAASDGTDDPHYPGDIENARVLLYLGDSVTTDHISPAGAIPSEYPAGRYLKQQGVAPEDFNSYGSRRGNHEVMMRGSFAHIRLKNKLTAPKEGGLTLKLPEKTIMHIFDAAEEYKKSHTPLLALGGKEYGSGSSRDWAAKGAMLLGIRAVIAVSYERIHRSNLVGMGILPLEFINGETAESLGLTGFETFSLYGINAVQPGAGLTVTVMPEKGSPWTFSVLVRIDTDVELEYYKNRGILPYVMKTAFRD